MSTRYSTFKAFYPFYLGEHQNRLCRRMHLIGSTLVLLTLVGVVYTGDAWDLLLLPLFGYGCAWIGHFFFEKNRPATFTYPFYSLMADWVMYRDMLVGRISF